MNKSIKDLNEKVQNYDVSFADFPIGQKVKVVSVCVDFLFTEGETGIVVRNNGKYLGIIVKLDDVRIGNEKDWTNEWGFNPKDLIKIGEFN